MKKKSEVKQTEKIITSVYLTKETIAAIDKVADKDGVSRTEQVRRYINKGLAIESYEEDIAMITAIIRNEINVSIKAQTNRLAGLINRLTIISAAGYYANIAIVSDLIDRDRYSSFEKIEAAARKKALAYANQRNADALAVFADDNEMKKAIKAVKGERNVDPDV